MLFLSSSGAVAHDVAVAVVVAVAIVAAAVVAVAIVAAAVGTYRRRCFRRGSHGRAVPVLPSCPFKNLYYLLSSARPPRTAPVDAHSIIAVSAGGGVAIVKIVAWPVAVPTVHANEPSPAKKTNEVFIGYDSDNHIHWILRRRIKSVLRSKVSDGYKRNIVTVGYFAYV